GSTNIPEPKVKSASGKIGLEPILDWKIGKFSLENGAMLFAGQTSELNARGEKLRAQFAYDLTGPRYKGQLSIQPLEIRAGKIAPVNVDVDLALGLEKNRIEISKARLDMGRSLVEASGSIEDLALPKGVFRFTSRFAVDQAGGWLKIPAARRGTIELAGTGNYNSPSDYTISASMIARGLEVHEDSIHVSGARATSLARFNPRGVQLDGLTVHLLGG